jgi:hypothetical protein
VSRRCGSGLTVTRRCGIDGGARIRGTRCGAGGSVRNSNGIASTAPGRYVDSSGSGAYITVDSSSGASSTSDFSSGSCGSGASSTAP